MTKLMVDEEMQKYVRPLYRVVLTRLLQQMSQIYTTIKLDTLMKLAAFPEPYHMSTHEIEKLIVHACRKGTFKYIL
jgi:translation initiation factor 3 subunit A